jgi:hypothetical protein
VSPALVEELCVSAGVLPSAEPCSLAPETWQALYTAWQGWLSKLHSKSFSPCSCSSSNRFSVLGTYPEAAASVHGLLDQYYFSLQAGEVYGGLYQKLCGAVKQALKKAKGRVYSFEQQLASAGDAAAVQRQGDIIVANLYRWGWYPCGTVLPHFANLQLKSGVAKSHSCHHACHAPCLPLACTGHALTWHWPATGLPLACSGQALAMHQPALTCHWPANDMHWHALSLHIPL